MKEKLRKELQEALIITATEIINLPSGSSSSETYRILENRLGPLLSIAEYFCNRCHDWEKAVKKAAEWPKHNISV